MLSMFCFAVFSIFFFVLPIFSHLFPKIVCVNRNCVEKSIKKKKIKKTSKTSIKLLNLEGKIENTWVSHTVLSFLAILFAFFLFDFYRFSMFSLLFWYSFQEIICWAAGTLIEIRPAARQFVSWKQCRTIWKTWKTDKSPPPKKNANKIVKGEGKLWETQSFSIFPSKFVDFICVFWCFPDFHFFSMFRQPFS